MEAELSASRVAVTGAFSLGLAVSALSAVPVGRRLDRRGPRALMTAGSMAAALLVFAWSRVQTVDALYAVWALMGLAMACTLYEPAFAAIVQWFAAGRDRALEHCRPGGLLMVDALNAKSYLEAGFSTRVEGRVDT